MNKHQGKRRQWGLRGVELAILGMVFLGCLLSLPGLASAAESKPSAADLEFFEKKIRPVLVAHCYRCHSTQSKRRPKANLLLDSRAGILKGGDTGPAVMAGNPNGSLLIQAIRYKDDLRMPPRSKLPASVIADLTSWVKRGLPWPSEKRPGVVNVEDSFNFDKRMRHWAFQPIQTISPPEVKQPDWASYPIDQFILARLEAQGLQPAPPADRRTWLRRVTYDLAGLPPTPQEIANFLADDSVDAHEKVVDRLLASPAYGERWGRHWLDLVRFAETHGHEFDFDIPHAYRYRDYIIRAFNADVPYDQLVREHVAGDLLPQPRRHPIEGFNESILGTGFWFLGEAKHSPVDLRGDGADRRDNQVDVFSKTFLALTVSCARCHDHKFDPIYTRDYYSLISYLQSSRYQVSFLDPPERFTQPIQQIEALREQARQLAVARSVAELSSRLKDLPAFLGAGRKRKAAPSTESLLGLWRALGDPSLTREVFQARQKELIQKGKAQLSAWKKQRESYHTFTDFRHGQYVLPAFREKKIPEKTPGGDNWFAAGHAFGHCPTQADDVLLQPGQSVPVQQFVGVGQAHSGLVSGKLQGALRSPTFKITKRYIHYRAKGRGVAIRLIIDGFQLIRNPIYGGLEFKVNSPTLLPWRWYVQDVSMWQGLHAYVEVLDDGSGHIALDEVVFSDDRRSPAPRPQGLLLRLLESPGVDTPVALRQKLQALLEETLQAWAAGKLDQQEDVEDRIALLNEVLQLARGPALMGNAADHKRIRELLDRASQLERTLPAPMRGLGMANGTGIRERIHIRGSHKNLGEEAPRQLLVALAGKNQPPAGKGSGRLQLAERMLSRSNPLLPRVLVNRLWQHHFGQGIVRSPDNFGAQGRTPTHPQLLDWLASELIRQGWSMKQMHRMMVLSSTYRMSSKPDPEAEKKDPENLLLHRMPIQRLEPEAIRDAMLALAGRLDRRMFGRGPLPHLTPFMIGRGRPRRSGPIDGDGRRSVYLNVRRNFLTPMFLAFDYPTPFTTIGRRSVSNVPAQALTLLNNPFVLQQAERWSQHVLAEKNMSGEERVRFMYRAALGRDPNQSELADALAFVDAQGKGDDPGAWADLCHVLFNVKEFIFVR